MSGRDVRVVVMSLYRADALVVLRVVFCVMASACEDMAGILIIFRC